MKIKKNNLKLLLIVLIWLNCNGVFSSCTKSNLKEDEKYIYDSNYNISTSKMHFRDPFIYVDTENRCYDLITTSMENGLGELVAYTSKDLKFWKKLGVVYKAPSSYLGTKDWWAADLYKWQGSYYVFVTVSGNDIKRGTTILKATDDVSGPYRPVLPDDELNVTPSNMDCLDGSLYVDNNGTPWIIFSHEWLECYDGEIYAQKLKKDLSGTEGAPIYLFKASDAQWSCSTGVQNGNACYVTDAPFIWKDEISGNLIILWSSFSKINGTLKYAFGQAISKTGSIKGPWIQASQPLNTDDGGHAMIFKDLDGNLRISYHSPNSYVSEDSQPTITIKNVTIQDGKIVLLSQ